MTAATAFETLLGAARDWHGSLPALSEFVPWPDDLHYVPRPACPLPVIPLLQTEPGMTSPQSRALCDALIAVASHVEWRHTYTEAEVGRDFLNRFGWFELAGPDGHFITHQTRMTVGYWGPRLYYDWHQHEPEELYSVVAGQAMFRVEGQEDQALSAGGTRLHASNQPHALETGDHPVLTFVLWRGEGLADPPRMSA